MNINNGVMVAPKQLDYQSYIVMCALVVICLLSGVMPVITTDHVQALTIVSF